VPPLTEADQRRIKDLSGNLEEVWRAKTTAMEERKALLRFLVKRVHLEGVKQEGKIHIDVEWHTGAHTNLIIDRPKKGSWAQQTPAPVVERIRELFMRYEYATVANKLNAEGYRTAMGRSFQKGMVSHIVRSRKMGAKRSNLEAVIDLIPAGMASSSYEHDTEVVSERCFGC
jgi:hypothetical protein